MGFLTVLVYCLISLFLGSLFLGLSLNLIDLTLTCNYLEHQILANPYSRMIVGILGILIILFCLRYLQNLVRYKMREKSITFSSGQGTVSITISALEDMIKKILEKREELSHIRPNVFLKKKEIEVIIRSYLTSEVNVVEFTKDIQEKIKEKLHSLLGEERQINIKVEIRKITFGEKKKITEEEPEVPFRHY